ncbi:tail protein X [Serratia sp. NPDC078593]|uniref:tail protein X n=1 Tax=unclassified Serratia (in: enterobacteria) TaxID=2647522 RepID=UPI0037CDF5F1
MKIYAQQGDTVDAICWRYYGTTQNVVEQVYHTNTGLAQYGPVLPHGYPVELPELTIAAKRETVKLWD